jgi:hypothetical protein
MAVGRTIKCKLGHTWVTTKDGDWYFMEFRDAAGQKIQLRACPMCFTQWVIKNVPTITNYKEPEPHEVLAEVDRGASSSDGSGSRPDATGQP